jgi:hypothetical protein
MAIAYHCTPTVTWLREDKIRTGTDRMAIAYHCTPTVTWLREGEWCDHPGWQNAKDRKWTAK